MSTCEGPGYATPLDAMNKGPKEKVLFVVCVQPREDKPDVLATVDVDPNSPTYQQVIHHTLMKHNNDELHHSGWNICSSCHGDKCKPKRDKLILPSLISGTIYIVDTSNERAPILHKVIEKEEMLGLDCGTPHTTHCMPSGDIMISVMGDKNDEAKCDFVLIDSKTYKMKGTWRCKGEEKNKKKAVFGYDFWYQPKFDTLISTEWGAPKIFKPSFDPEHVKHEEYYGRSLNIFSYKTGELKQVINLGEPGIAPLEIRFLHNPDVNHGFVGCAVNSTVFRFFADKKNEPYKVEKVISIPSVPVKNWVTPELNGMVTDILLSLDDRFLYLSCWLQGDVRQYDVSDPKNPKLTGQIYLGGHLVKDSNLEILPHNKENVPKQKIDPTIIKGKRLHGAPQMLQLSLDGKRLYVSSSLYSKWDKQVYPNMYNNGGWIVKLDVDVKNGGMTLDENFLVDFTSGPEGPLLPHEMRYPGGDCTSDIWLSKECC